MTSISCAKRLRNALIDSGARGTADAFLASLSEADIAALSHDWAVWARDDQMPPPLEAKWLVWLVLGGRGAGKTRAGAEWVRGLALGLSPFAARPVGRIALVAETAADLREVMIEGVSGLLAVHEQGERPSYEVSRRRLVWPNGAIAQGFSAEDPESLRGPQFGAAWSDELAKWRYAQETWDMLQLGLRLGERPRQMVTTTPRPIGLLKGLIADPRTWVTRSPTRMNAANLAPGFLERVVGLYGGTRLGRQELEGEIIDDRPDALWGRALIEALRVEAAADSADGAGGVVSGFTPVADIYAAVDPLTFAAQEEARRMQVAVSHRIVVRHRDDVTVHHRLRSGARIFAIRAVVDLGAEGRFLEITAQETLA